MVATTAKQTISYAFSDDSFQQRTDRSQTYDDYWRYAHRSLKLDFSLVIQTGANASVCFNRGGNPLDGAVPFGYADRYLSDYLLHVAQQTAILDVVRQFNTSRRSVTVSNTHDAGSNTNFPTLTHHGLNLELLITNGTWLPYAVRSREQHNVWGPSTSDVVFSNFTKVAFGDSYIKFPSRIQTIYNGRYVLEDYVNDKVTVNPEFPNGFFDAVPPTDPTAPPASFHPHPPHTDDEYPRSEVHEFYESGLWFGPFGDQNNVSTVVAKPVFPGGSIPQIINLYVGGPNYVQLLVDFEDGILLVDAPPHRFKILSEWVKRNIPGKKITHVVATHHHRDHTGGIGEFLADGAILVVPEVAKNFYSKTTNVTFTIQTYTENKPFVKKDKNVQFMSFWADNNPHAQDWVWSLAAPACSSNFNRSEVVIFNTDVINPSPGPNVMWDTSESIDFFHSAVKQGVPIEATLVGAHGHTPYGLGTQDYMAHLAEIAGFPYPASSGKVNWC